MSSLLPIRCQRLKELRKEKKKTQSEIAKEIDVTEKTYRSWEIGTYKKNCGTTYPQPDLDSLIKLATFYNCSIDYLIGFSNCKHVDNHYISQKTGLTDSSINSLAYINTIKGRHVKKAINTLICNVFEKDTEESRLSFIELFANYLFYNGNNEEYSLDSVGHIEISKPILKENEKAFYNTNKLHFYSKQLEQMFIMEMNDEIKRIKNGFYSNK